MITKEGTESTIVTSVATEQTVTAAKESNEATVSISEEQTEQTITVSAENAEQEIEITRESLTIDIGDYDFYSGTYTVTPAASTQTISTNKKILTEDIVINPIPSNYGLITWDGSTLTVS